MTILTPYEAAEASIEDGRPITLFKFSLANEVTSWYYTSADRDISYDGHVWISALIKADSVKQTGEAVNDNLNLDVPNWIAPAQLFMTQAPSSALQIIIYSKHAHADETFIQYNGEITQVNFPIPGRAVISCESLASSLNREGLRLAWQRSCPYALYDPRTCKVDKADWKINLTVLAIDGLTIDVELDVAQATGYLDSGFIEWAHPVRGMEYLAIESHTALTPAAPGDANARLLLLSTPGELFEGAVGGAYPGCNFTPANCQAFSNYDNYGGVPDLPGKSPFDGDPVF